MIKINFNENEINCIYINENNIKYIISMRICDDPICNCNVIGLTFEQVDECNIPINNRRISFDINLIEKTITDKKK